MGTSKLQQLTGKRILEEFGFSDLRENYRPDWMQSEKGERLELDFYIPSIQVAVEVQGRQHFVFTPRFHSDYECFLVQQKRDRAKAQICEAKGILLWEVLSISDIDLVIEKIRPMVSDNIRTKAPQILSYEDWDSVLVSYIKYAMRATPEGRIKWGQRIGRQKVATKKLAQAEKTYSDICKKLGNSEKVSHKNTIAEAKRTLDRRTNGLAESKRFTKADFDYVSRGVVRFLAENHPPLAFIANHPLISTQAEDRESYTYKEKYFVE